MLKLNTLNKVKLIQSKLLLLTASINYLKLNNIVKIYSLINNILTMLKDLLISSKTNNIEVTHILKQISDLKLILKLAKQMHMSDINQLKKDILAITHDLRKLLKEVNNIKVHLVLNDGQTNQCYIAIEKILKILLKYQPTLVILQSMLFTNAEQQIKKVFYKIIAGIIITIITGIVMYFGTKYYNSIIVDLYNRQTTTLQQPIIRQSVNLNVVNINLQSTIK